MKFSFRFFIDWSKLQFFIFMEGSDPKWVNHLLNNIGVNSLKLRGLHLVFTCSTFLLLLIYTHFSLIFYRSFAGPVHIPTQGTPLHHSPWQIYLHSYSLHNFIPNHTSNCHTAYTSKTYNLHFIQSPFFSDIQTPRLCPI